MQNAISTNITLIAILVWRSIIASAVQGRSKDFPPEQEEQDEQQQRAADRTVGADIAEVPHQAEDQPDQHEYPEREAKRHAVLLCRLPGAYRPHAWALDRLCYRKSEHHQRVASCRHQIIELLDDLAVLAVIEPELLEPVGEMRKHLELAGLHAAEHFHQAGFDAAAAVHEGCA